MIKPLVAVTPTSQPAGLAGSKTGATTFLRLGVRQTVQRPILFPIEGWIEFWRDDVFCEPPKTARETRAVPAQRLKDIS